MTPLFTPHLRPGSRAGRVVLRGLCLTAACVLAAGCDRPAGSARQGSTSAGRSSANSGLASTLVADRAVELEENDEVINVDPEIFRDPRGGFLVADSREAQVRSYSAAGRLRWHAGRRGGGPGEFRAPAAAVRLRSGEVAVFDRRERLVVFDSVGGAVARTFRTTLRQVSDAAVLDDSSLLVAGIGDDRWEGPRLHVLDPATGRIRARFFAPFARSPYPAAASFAGWTKVAVRGDTIAAIFAVSDSVYYFTADGHPLRTVPIPFTRFRPASRRVPDNGNSNLKARIGWMSSFDMVADVHFLADGDVVVPFQNFDPDDGATRHWHLLAMTRDGRRLREIREVPRLLEVEGSSLFFVDPNAEAPNRWIEAHLPR